MSPFFCNGYACRCDCIFLIFLGNGELIYLFLSSKATFQKRLMNGISAIIITLNEEAYIEQCLESLEGIADEIIVVDSYSTDSTEKICRRFNAHFVSHSFSGFMEQKNFSLSLANYPYVLSLDADEMLSDELRSSLLKEKEKLENDGYQINRLNNYCGQWIRHSGWYPDRQLRLFNREKGAWGEMNVHETFHLSEGTSVGRLKGDILHYVCKSRDEFTSKIERYSSMAAAEMFRRGYRSWFLKPLMHMIWRFFRTYIIHLGFLDGKNGLAICADGAWSSYLKYKKLRDLNKSRS